jgi:hypothetical protein
MKPEDFFGKSDDDDNDIPDLGNIDDILNFGLRAGSSQSKRTPEGGLPFKGGTLEDMMDQDDADLELEITKMMQDFEEDPIAATRRQLVRMAVTEWRHLQKLYKEFAKSGLRPDRSKILRFEIESSTTNLLKLQSALKALPVQRKDEITRDNVSSLSELLECQHG